MAHPATKNPVALAIDTFEAATGLHVTVHDLTGQLGPRLEASQERHSQPVCRMVKNAEAGWRCYDFEVTQLRAQWEAWPHGRVHRCHAGLIEWMAPIAWDGRLLGVLFAGQAVGDESLCDLVQVSSSASRGRTRAGLKRLDHVDEAARLLESLRQLAARLLLLILRSPGDLQTVGPQRSRRATIEEYIATHQHRAGLSVTDLAAQLHLSPSRTSHLVAELFGQSFGQILNAARMRHACDLLHHTDRPVADVGQAVGLPDPGHFHRLFKRHLGVTPATYRQHPHEPA